LPNTDYELEVIRASKHEGVSTQPDTVFLLIHGKNRELQNASYWIPHLETFTQYGDVYASSLLGFGKSKPSKDEELSVGVEDLPQLEALQALLKHNELVDKKLILVGRSWGGKLALELAATHPNSIKKMILIAPAIHPEQVKKLPDSVRKVPVLLCWADGDPVIKFDRQPDIKKAFPNVQVHTFKGLATHVPEHEKPDAWHKALASFL